MFPAVCHTCELSQLGLKNVYLVEHSRKKNSFQSGINREGVKKNLNPFPVRSNDKIETSPAAKHDVCFSACMNLEVKSKLEKK